MSIVEEKESIKTWNKSSQRRDLIFSSANAKEHQKFSSKEKLKHIQQWQFNRASKAVNHHLTLSDEYKPPLLYRHETNSDLCVNCLLIYLLRFVARVWMVTLRGGGSSMFRLATRSCSCRAPPPMKQKAGHTGAEQSTCPSHRIRKEWAS